MEILVSPDLNNPEVFDIVLYGYNYFTNTKELFSELLTKFRTVPPLNMSPTEREKYFY